MLIGEKLIKAQVMKLSSKLSTKQNTYYTTLQWNMESMKRFDSIETIIIKFISISLAVTISTFRTIDFQLLLLLNGNLKCYFFTFDSFLICCIQCNSDKS